MICLRSYKTQFFIDLFVVPFAFLNAWANQAVGHHVWALVFAGFFVITTCQMVDSLVNWHAGKEREVITIFGKDGWPVERIYGKPFTNLLRILIHGSLRQTFTRRSGVSAPSTAPEWDADGYATGPGLTFTGIVQHSGDKKSPSPNGLTGATGFTLIELLLVLGVVSVVSVIGFFVVVLVWHFVGHIAVPTIPTIHHR